MLFFLLLGLIYSFRYLNLFSNAFRRMLFVSANATQVELLEKIKEYNVKFVLPDPTKLPPPVLGLHGKNF